MVRLNNVGRLLHSLVSALRALSGQVVIMRQSLQLSRYERIFLRLGILVLVVWLIALGVDAFAENINPPTGTQTLDPTKYGIQPGLNQTGPNTYDAYYVARVFSFEPADLKIPVNSTVTFYVTSADVVHGFFVPHTNINMMAVPGWVNAETHHFSKRETYLLLCHEYCGIGHQDMFAKIEVQ
jgi:cytochrome c oxidase subunit II